ncbi:hypothetical protein jhhlp_003449 [Lomentospora prolificans]|uniref:Uncharacterized protein n=1 Tax=Lomentospora prolificans TaxID=41688 RepID=A0A2N3N8S7_9PEZI|nr:hypothetical protein jhhlp_003449 [Lomentospora prolificans]
MSHGFRRRAFAAGLHAAIRNALVTLFLVLFTTWVPAALAAAPAKFPYIPTIIVGPALTSEDSTTAADKAYVFRENGENIEFLSLDIGAVVDGDNGWETLVDKLPFMEAKSDTTIYSPSLTENGHLVVYVGDCNSGSDFEIWTYTPSSTSDDDPVWEQQTTSISDDITYPAPNFLGASISFSSQVQPTVSDPVLYTFGGMCANSSHEVTSWQYLGRYTNQMRKASIESNSEYTLSIVPSKGPVREAGFTLTRLLPSLSYRGDIVTQRSNYVLLGGHTQEAFVNMSTAAVWNLPEESWSFVNIKAPSTRSEELRANVSHRSQQSEDVVVDSRSGHTTVLSEDGSTLIMLGGWVGNVNRAAQPQLAILRMGASYDDWQWEIPDIQPEGNGIYGHGAALLPGNVMMVYGGYEITPADWAKSKRQLGSNSPQFLNLTTMTWDTSYANPSYTGEKPSPSGGGSSKGEKPGEEGGKDDKAKRLGLGIGLGVGIPLLIAIIAFVFFYRRHSRRRRTMRDDAIRALAQDRALFLQNENEMSERDYDTGYQPFSWTPQSWYSGGGNAYDNGARSLGYETLRGGNNRNSLPVHPALQVPRKPISRTSRGLYQAAGTSNIHPIYEADEDAEQHENKAENRARENESPSSDSANEPQTPTSQRYSDPFASPVAPVAPVLYPSGRSSATPSPENPRMDPEVQDWMSDLDAAECLLARMNRRQSGTTSPAKASTRSSAIADEDSRTGSNLSDRSAISLARSASGRSYLRPLSFGLGFGTGIAADGRAGSSSSSSPSYNTAKSSFTVLQAEGPNLLYPGAGNSEPDHERQNHPDHYDDQEDDVIPVPGSPSKMKPRRGWLGSLRRVFAPSTGPDQEPTSEPLPTRASMERASADYEPRASGLGSIGGSLLRRKQGKHAWESEVGAAGTAGGLTVPTEAEPRCSTETDWDIERAVEQRLVQVMFTVPREKLRVVNAEVDGDLEASMSGLGMERLDLGPARDSRPSHTSDTVDEKLEIPEVSLAAHPIHEPLSDLDDPFLEPLDQEVSSESEGEGDEHSTRQPMPDAVVKPLSLASFQPPPPPTPEIPRRSIMRDTTSSRESEVLRTADTMKFGRPKTKVLEMVESIEGRSRENSPKRDG